MKPDAIRMIGSGVTELDCRPPASGSAPWEVCVAITASSSFWFINGR